MAALVRHFGDVEDASRPCGVCDVCDPAGAVLRLFRRAAAAERELARAIVEELRGVAYKAAGTLQRSLGGAARMSRGEFDGLLGAMAQAGLIEMEEAEYEKDGEVRRFRKVRLTDAGREMRAGNPVELLISDGIVEEFSGRVEAAGRAKKGKAAAGKEATKPGLAGAGKAGTAKAETAAAARLPAEGEALAARIREWRGAEAKRLRVPAYVVMHDRTVTALAQTRPRSPKELLAIDGIGPAKVEKFGEAILGLCAGGPGEGMQGWP
jgi:superfamily II DNA helicase RecQ